VLYCMWMCYILYVIINQSYYQSKYLALDYVGLQQISTRGVAEVTDWELHKTNPRLYEVSTI